MLKSFKIVNEKKRLFIMDRAEPTLNPSLAESAGVNRPAGPQLSAHWHDRGTGSRSDHNMRSVMTARSKLRKKRRKLHPPLVHLR